MSTYVCVFVCLRSPVGNAVLFFVLIGTGRPRNGGAYLAGARRARSGRVVEHLPGLVGAVPVRARLAGHRQRLRLGGVDHAAARIVRAARTTLTRGQRQRCITCERRAGQLPAVHLAVL